MPPLEMIAYVCAPSNNSYNGAVNKDMGLLNDNEYYGYYVFGAKIRIQRCDTRE